MLAKGESFRPVISPTEYMKRKVTTQKAKKAMIKSPKIGGTIKENGVCITYNDALLQNNNK